MLKKKTLNKKFYLKKSCSILIRKKKTLKLGHSYIPTGIYTVVKGHIFWSFAKVFSDLFSSPAKLVIFWIFADFIMPLVSRLLKWDYTFSSLRKSFLFFGFPLLRVKNILHVWNNISHHWITPLNWMGEWK